MTSLSLSPSQSSLSSATSGSNYAPPSPESVSSASSSKLSLDQQDEENLTITAKRIPQQKVKKQKSQKNLRLLAISTHMTELRTRSPISRREFRYKEQFCFQLDIADHKNCTEIQELRHKSSLGTQLEQLTSSTQSLMSLDEKLERPNETATILRKHITLVAEWEAVQDESEVLREELKEDKWLTVFRTVTDQADGMMSSLEKGVNRCQEFIWQVHRRGIEDTMGNSQISLTRPEKVALTIETFTTLFDSFEAKKKHYMPATSKVLAIIDKGVRDRVTKNGETLRRHAETFRERIARTDADMGSVRQILTHGDASSEHDSSGTASSQNGYLATPPNGRAPSSSSTISRSISPFKKFARRLTGSAKSPVSPVTPLSINKTNASGSRTTSSEPVLRRQKTSLFTSLRGPSTPITPDRPSHKYSQSLTPDSSPRNPRVDLKNTSGRNSNKLPWNSSTKVEHEATIKATPPKRAPSAAGLYGDASYASSAMNLSGGTYRRSVSRTSMASSRPWSPVTSSVSTNQSSTAFPRLYPPPPPIPFSFRPPSRAQTPSRARTPGLTTTTPRPRPKTPSHIPGPSDKLKYIAGKSDAGWDDDESVSGRAFSPTQSVTSTPGGGLPPRPPSRSMIPSPSLTFKVYAARSQTPESALKARAQQVPVYQGTLGRSSARPSLPPSSFREASTSRAPSRSTSRTGAFTPSGTSGLPIHEYVPGNNKDPLDIEVAFVVNSIAHGLLVERVDPPLRRAPGENEEVKAQYAFSNALSRKVVTCKLTTLTRSGKSGMMTTKKVMCRVGGGWQDLSHYILNRQAGM
ncbi:hypothetical protein DFJ43DRAFT_1059886 [Lentinula guzmanii]|uniref:GAR domain-containing protein n=1 Tax=Lentinula guzmanii TaxID=2804957 RepID=A0AA38JH58_9AGAR|nr:hypothetical protein DFJ43DRAFT_1059886 [Lentinula guzmanii]